MWKTILFLICILLPRFADARVPLSDYQQYSIVSYSNGTATQLDWMGQKYSWRVGGTVQSGHADNWMTYTDFFNMGIPALASEMEDWGFSVWIDPEEVFLHSKVDYTSVASSWYQLDKFDKFETNTCVSPPCTEINGVLRTEDNDATYTDYTTAAYSSTMGLHHSTYIGYQKPFDQINFTFATYGVNSVNTWEYWNGTTWATLSVTDGTADFTQNGTVEFTPPSTWGRKAINGSRAKFWVRLKVLSSTTSAVSSKIFGDPWYNDGVSTHCRGWDGADSNIINAGELAYNPTPPTGATAKFKYQSRITSKWGTNHFIANIADSQVIGTLKPTWSAYLVYATNSRVTAGGYDGMMGDDQSEDPSATDGANRPLDTTDYVDKTLKTWPVKNQEKLAEIVAGVHALNTAHVVGVNITDKAGSVGVDYNLQEYHSFVSRTSDPRGIIVGDGSSTRRMYDDYLPANNPGGMFGIMIYADTAPNVPWSGSPNMAWDRANRGPIAALSKHLIAANEYTIFEYYSTGGAIYNEHDDVILKDTSVVYLSNGVVPDISLVDRWANYFPAMDINLGVPDTNGYNGGIRDLEWKTSADLGSVSDQPMWRRDYTNCIVLHVPAMSHTSLSSYSTYSTAIPLGDTYYPLLADGTTGAGVTSIQLRAGEGAILMKHSSGSSCANDPTLCVTTESCTTAAWNWCDGNCQSAACVAEPTCSDGARNGDETGTDCGGSCLACTPGGAGLAIGGGLFKVGTGRFD